MIKTFWRRFLTRISTGSTWTPRTTYEQTKLELQLLQKKVKPSGVIAGDDWQPDPAHPHHGVYKAVQEVIAEGKYRILYADTYNLQWAIGRRDRPSPSATP